MELLGPGDLDDDFHWWADGDVRKRAGARITDVNAGHLSLISKPSVVTRVILEAVQATG